MSDGYRLVKHRGKWALAYTDPARKPPRVRISTGKAIADRGGAEAVARRIWAELHKPLSERLEDIWPVYVADRMAVVSRKDRYASLWKALSPHFGHRLGKAVNATDCRDYYKHRKAEGKSDSTVKTELEFLRACLRFRYGVEAPRLWLPPESAPRDRYLTKEELNRLLDNIETHHVRLFVMLAASTGARHSAIVDLTWERVDMERGTVDLMPAGRHRTNKRRPMVPVTPKCLEALKEAKAGAVTDNVIEWDGKPVKSVRKAVRSAARRAKIPCSPHVFRHTAGVWMAEADVPMQKIAQVLGHTSTRVTERVYARYSPSFLRDASAALEF